jgi:wyosine [tRNA(Phe)-imidazoG37] synthetase (radical SAM superfamily)
MAIQYVEQHFYTDSLQSAEANLVDFMNQFEGEMYLETTIVKKDNMGNDYIVAIFMTEGPADGGTH